MCACYFRAHGEAFDVDAFLSKSPWRDKASISRKGETKSRGKTLRDYSCLSLLIADDDCATVAQQITACRTFIAKHLDELSRLKDFPGVQAKCFSLAYYLMIGEVYAIGPHFGSDFLSDLLGVGAEFEFNVFCTSVE